MSKKRCGRVSCKEIATHVSMDGLFHVYLCDEHTKVNTLPSGRVFRLTEPGATSYLTG